MSDKQPFDVVQVLFDKARLDQDLRRIKGVLTEAIDVLEAIPDRTIGQTSQSLDRRTPSRKRATLPMKWLIGATGIALALSLTACNGHSKQSATSTTLSAQAKQDFAQAQAIVQGCLSKGNVITHDGRQAILACIAPKGHEQAFETCAQSKAGSDGVLSKAQRAKFYQDLAVCVENNR